MSVRILTAMSVATAMAFAAACANDNPTPLTPSGVAVSDTSVAGDANEDAPDGSTLKVNAPAPLAPVSGAELDDAEPVFQVTNAEPKFAAIEGLEYRFEVNTEAGVFVMNSVKVASGEGTTSWAIPTGLDQGVYRWRARAELGTDYGPWSEFLTFTITAPPSLLPPGPYPHSPDDIVHFVGRAYPDKLKSRVSLGERKANMAFIRDRIIEVGLCVGHTMGRNLKRGGPEHSYDFLAWKTGGKTWGVDIARGYDDLKKPLRLGWSMHAPRAFFDPIRNPERCRN